MIDDASLLKKSVVSMFTEANMLKYSDDNKKFIQFYTGLPNPKSLCTIFKFVTAAAGVSSLSTAKVSSFEEFMIILMKLKLNPPMQDLAFHSGCCSTVQRVF